MITSIGRFVAVALFVGGIGLCGCNPKKKIQLRYERPAAITVPGEIKRIGIAEFGGATAEDKRWGAIASDRLSAALAEYNRKYHRYELVDRQRLKAFLDERDLQIQRSARWCGFGVFWLVYVFGLMGTWAWFQHRGIRTISLDIGVVPLFVFGPVLLILVVDSITSVILYRRGR